MLQLDFAAVVFQVVVAHVLSHSIKIVIYGENESQFSIQKTTINEVNLEEGPERS